MGYDVAERDRIVAGNARVVSDATSPYAGGDPHRYEELKQEGSLALVRAATRWLSDPDVSSRYDAGLYARVSVRNAVRDAAGRSSRWRRGVSLDAVPEPASPCRRGSSARVEAALTAVSSRPDLSGLVAAVYGLGGREPVSLSRYARSRRRALKTVRRLHGEAIGRLASALGGAP